MPSTGEMPRCARLLGAALVGRSRGAGPDGRGMALGFRLASLVDDGSPVALETHARQAAAVVAGAGTHRSRPRNGDRAQAEAAGWLVQPFGRSEIVGSVRAVGWLRPERREPRVTRGESAVGRPGRGLWTLSLVWQLAAARAVVAAVTSAAWGPFTLDTRHVDLQLAPGWNLISLPLEPIDPHTAALAMSATGDAASPSRHATDAGPRDAAGGTVVVWAWEAAAYVATAELHVHRGYWVHRDPAGGRCALMIPGAPPTGGGPAWKPGWNLVGPVAGVALPLPGGIRGPIWWWDATAARYRPLALGEELVPGRGYWVCVGATER
jgi:hypothetical protein